MKQHVIHSPKRKKRKKKRNCWCHKFQVYICKTHCSNCGRLIQRG